jgi:hypothetical protein
MIEVQRVPLEWVPRTWPLVAPFISDGVAFAADGLTEDEVRVHVFDGRWVLFVAVEHGTIRGACAVELFNRGRDRVAFVTTIGGKFISGRDVFARFSEQLRSLGATALEGAARESVARLWARCGFVEKHRIVGVAL